jgi:hypothetical protein
VARLDWRARLGRKLLKGGGAGGIRTLDRALQPYNGLANRRLQPLGHSSVAVDMPDAGAGRKRQIRIPVPADPVRKLNLSLAAGNVAKPEP